MTGIGIELGNARIKIAADAPGGLRARAYPVPVRGGVPRGGDIADGLAGAVHAFREETGLCIEDFPVVVSCSNQFAYPTFQTALIETVALLRRHVPRALLAGGSRLHDLDEAEALADRPEGALEVAAARMAGIRGAAGRCGTFALAVDCGTTSTEIVPLLASGGEAWPNEGRLTDGRLVWVGLLETPIDYVAREAAGYTIVPRVARMAAVAGFLGLAGPAIAPTAADRASLAAELAQGVGLDAAILAGDEIERIARALREAAVTHLAAAIDRVLRRGGMARETACGSPGGASAAVMGLGKAALAKPALAACGISDVVDVEAAIGVPPNFGAVAGLALLASSSGVDHAYEPIPGPAAEPRSLPVAGPLGSRGV